MRPREPRTFVVFGRDADEHEREIGALRQSGEASEGDHFMRLTPECGMPAPRPWGPFSLTALLQRIAAEGRTIHGRCDHA